MHMSTHALNTIRSPKLLPWLAKKAGISESRSLVLWREACRHAAHRAEPESSLYFKLAVDRLVELVAAESLREDAASFGWRPWVRAQRRFWSAAVHAYESGSLLATRSIRSLTALQART
jgi:hypothetical protein